MRHLRYAEGSAPYFTGSYGVYCLFRSGVDRITVGAVDLEIFERCFFHEGRSPFLSVSPTHF